MNKIGLIIGREYLSRVRKKSFLILTIVVPILMVGLLVGAAWIGQADVGEKKVHIVDSNYFVQPNDFKDTKQCKFSFSHGTQAEAKASVESGEFDLALWLPERLYHHESAFLYFDKEPGEVVKRMLSGQLNRFGELIKVNYLRDSSGLQLSLEQFDEIKKDVRLIFEHYADDSKTGLAKVRWGVGFAFSVLIYMFIFLYGVQVMRGVIEEKTNRIVEVIVSSVKPFELMMGKIVGIMCVGLTQLTIWVIIGTTLFSIALVTIFPEFTYDPEVIAQEMAQISTNVDPSVANEIQVSIPENEVIETILYKINWPFMIGLFVFYFIGGYLLYGALFAAIGAAVDNEADTQQFMLPITLPLVFGFVIAQSMALNPDGPAGFWFAQIPFTSPVVMMVKAPFGFDNSGWPYVLSMVLLVITFICATWIAGKIYRIGILMYGKKPSWKEMYKWLFYKA